MEEKMRSFITKTARTTGCAPKLLFCPLRQGFVAMALSTEGEGQAAGKQHGGSVLVPGTVLVVAQQGKSAAGKLHPDLVAAAGMEPDADQ